MTAKKTPIAKEATEDKSPLTFDVEVGGKTITITDKWDGDGAPGALMFMGSETYAQKYAPALLEQIIGAEQIATLLDAGVGLEELLNVVGQWSEARGLKN